LLLFAMTVAVWVFLFSVGAQGASPAVPITGAAEPPHRHRMDSRGAGRLPRNTLGSPTRQRRRLGLADQHGTRAGEHVLYSALAPVVKKIQSWPDVDLFSQFP
jgi:hypothetical protein